MYAPPSNVSPVLQPCTDPAPLQHYALAGFSRPTLDLHESQLLRAVESHAGSGETYTLMAKHTIGGIALLVFTRDRSVTSRIVDVRVGTAGFGLGGLMGNKGAVGVRLVVDETAEDDAGKTPDLNESSTDEEDATSFTFVSTHLAAHQEQCARRAADWQALVERLVFTPYGPAAAFVPHRSRDIFRHLGRYNPKAMGGPVLQIYDSSYLFVFGVSAGSPWSPLTPHAAR